MRRSVPLLLGLTAGAAFFAACRDGAVTTPESAAPATVGAPAALSLGESSTTFSVTIDPTRNTTYTDGITTIVLPAGSICDVATSGYGPGTWDAPCAPATAPITVPVTVTVKNGRMLLYFGKDMRFVPTSDPARQVVMTVNVPAVKTAGQDLRRYAIFWVPSNDSRFVDEGAQDRSLVTIVRQNAGTLTRRLKHFSGYSVSLGTMTDCDPDASETDDCIHPPAGTVTQEETQ